MVSLIITIAVIGMLVWAINAFLPIPDPFKRIILGIAVFVVILYVLSFFGFIGGGPHWNAGGI